MNKPLIPLLMLSLWFASCQNTPPQQKITFDNIKNKFIYFDIDTMNFNRKYEHGYFTMDSIFKAKHTINKQQQNMLGFNNNELRLFLDESMLLLSLNTYKNYYIMGLGNENGDFICYHLCDKSGKPVKFLFFAWKRNGLNYNIADVVLMKDNEIEVLDLYCGWKSNSDTTTTIFYCSERHFKVKIFDDCQTKADTISQNKEINFPNQNLTNKYLNEFLKKYGAKYLIDNIKD